MGKWLNRFLPETHNPRTDTLDTVASVSRVSVQDLGILKKTSLWNADDWRTYFDERVGMATEGGLSPDRAERQALFECINHWLALNPDLHGDPDRCPHCGDVAGVTADILCVAYANPGGWPLWLHEKCFLTWWEGRKNAAIMALAQMGIKGTKA